LLRPQKLPGGDVSALDQRPVLQLTVLAFLRGV